MTEIDSSIDFKLNRLDGAEPALIDSLIELERGALGDDAYDHASWAMLIDHGLVIAASDQEAIIGVIAFIRNWQESGKAYLATLVVKREFQGHGIGMSLIEESLRRLNAEEISEIELLVAPDNEAAIKLYERFGFKRTGSPKPVYRPDSERLRMKRQQEQWS